MIQGTYVDQQIMQIPIFQDSLTKQFSISLVKTYINSIYENEDAGQEGAVNVFKWESYIDNVTKNRLRTKYMDLVSKSEYVTKAEASIQYEIEESKADYAYVYVPFTAITDSTITIEDSELENYISENSSEFQVEESRTINMIRFPILPSGADSTAFDLELATIKKEFAEQDKDTSYVSYRSDNPINPSYLRYDALSYNLKRDSANLANTIMGPYFENGQYTIFKIKDQRIADTTKKASASHILFKITDAVNQPLSEEGKEEQKIKALDVLAKARAGEDFAKLAEEYSEGPSASKGGDLGEFTEGAMVPEFQEAVFDATRTGLINKLVETQFGFHIIKVDAVVEEELIYEYYVAQVAKIFNPSSATKNELFQKANLALQGLETIEDLEKYTEDNEGVTLLEASNLSRESTSAGAVLDARPVVQWAFRAEEGTISEKVLQLEKDYIIAGLKIKQDKGTANVETVRPQVERKVRNEKIAALLSSDLEKYKSEEIFDIKQKVNEEKGEGFAMSHKEIGLTLGSNNTKVGLEPTISGTVLGLQEGQKSDVVVGENGVFIVAVIKTEKPEVKEDLEIYKTRLKSGNTAGKLDEAVKELSDITDNRHLIF
jgi:peptidyl-prolyl cis-trans isomerase D